MKIKEILQKQGEIYKNLSSNKIIQESNKTIKPKPLSHEEKKKIVGEIENYVREKDLLCGILEDIPDWKTMEIAFRGIISEHIKQGKLKIFGKTFNNLKPKVREYIEYNYFNYGKRFNSKSL